MWVAFLAGNEASIPSYLRSVMRSRSSVGRSLKTTRPRNYRTYRVNHTIGHCTCQKPSSPDKTQVVTSMLVLIVYTLVLALLVVAFFITQNYAMLSVATVMANEIGYSLRCMIESTFVQKRGKKKGYKKMVEVAK